MTHDTLPKRRTKKHCVSMAQKMLLYRDTAYPKNNKREEVIIRSVMLMET